MAYPPLIYMVELHLSARVINVREHPASIPAQLVREDVPGRKGLQLAPDARVVRGRARGALVLVAQLAPERHADRPVRPPRDQRLVPIEQQRRCRTTHERFCPHLPDTIFVKTIPTKLSLERQSILVNA